MFQVSNLFLSLHAILHKHKKVSLFFIENTIKVVSKVSSADQTI